MPYVPYVSLCIHLYEIHTIGSNLHVCLDFETRVLHLPILVLHFDCIRMGTSGISWLKPEEGSGTQKPNNSTNLPESHDQVNFESEDDFAIDPCTSTFSPEDEISIGQLKL